MEEQVFILATGVHPDDIELSCTGTLIKHTQSGKRVGILDFTKGELGTRGTPELRLEEAAASARVMGVAFRENAGFRDGFFRNDEEHQLILIKYIRRWRPMIVIANALEDRHPDHGRAGRLMADACFLAGLAKVETTDDDGSPQKPWRPKRIFHYMQDRLLVPHFIVDTTPVFDKKIESVRCFKSQFHNPDSKEPETYISSQNFIEQLRYRDALMGKRIGTDYGEGFLCENIIGLHDFNNILLPEVA